MAFASQDPLLPVTWDRTISQPCFVGE